VRATTSAGTGTGAVRTVRTLPALPAAVLAAPLAENIQQRAFQVCRPAVLMAMPEERSPHAPCATG
jgi:hypothetical protein